MRAHRYRLPLAAAVAVVAAGVATFVLRPRSGLIDPAAVEQAAYFSTAELERARDFQGPQRVIAIAGLLVSVGTLGVIALRPPARVRRLVEGASRRPLARAALAGGALVVVLAVVSLPLDAVAHRRAVDAGLSTQGFGAWGLDLAKATAIAMVMAAGGATLAVALIRRFPRGWWAPAALAAAILSAGYLYVAPVLLDPLFNRFEPLPAGKLRDDVLELAERAGVDVGEVYGVDASRRTTAANAYVGGLGGTKRVVLYDTLTGSFSRDQVRSVVAHELAHVRNRDLQRGLLWIAIVAGPGMLLVQRLTERFARRWSGGDDGAALGSGAAVPALALALALVSLGAQVAGNVLSRQVEARADAFALELTREPAAFIGLERSLAVRNLSEPSPPAVTHALFGTHPTTLERIGYGLAWARER